MESRKLCFEVEASNVTLEQIYQSDFLELQMRAISTANPNLNNSWFTLESLENSKESCRNKPILGYFNDNNDFEGHNGVWRVDQETGLPYWDTKNGEQILGIIRDDDEIKIVHDDESGLDWLCLSCAIWTQYNFKQVKRLFKDAMKAKKTGGVAKNISVEIDILEGEKQENGIFRIDKFNLIGVTILGSRNGKQIQPGIENAALSLPEIAGTDFYSTDMYAKNTEFLRAVYSRLENNEDNENDTNIKEESLHMENENNVQVLNEQTQSQNLNNEPEVNSQFAEEVCPECGNNPCTCSHDEDNHDEDHDGDHDDDEHEDEACKMENEKEECGGEHMEEGNCQEENHEEDPKPEAEPENVQQNADENQHTGEARDVAWLIGHMNYSFEELNYCKEYYQFLLENHPEEAPHGGYIIKVLDRCASHLALVEGTLGALLGKIAGELTIEDEAYEDKLGQYEAHIDEFINKYEDSLNVNNSLQEEIKTFKSNFEYLMNEKQNLLDEQSKLVEKVHAFEKAEFLKSAKNLIDSANLSDEASKQIYEACENSDLQKIEDVKVKIGLALFEAQQNNDCTLLSSKSVNLNTQIDAPNTNAAFGGQAEKPQKRGIWDKIRDYNTGK